MDTNPYAPPKAFVADIVSREASPPLWNPNAAARWSLVFSPVFGAFLHMKNWEALGEPAKAAAAKVWVIALLSLLIVVPTAIMFWPDLHSLSGPLGIVLLISWYSSSGRSQVHYVKQRFGQDYPRRGWGKPLLIALAAVVGYFVVLVALATVLAMMTGVGIAGAGS